MEARAKFEPLTLVLQAKTEPLRHMVLEVTMVLKILSLKFLFRRMALWTLCYFLLHLRVFTNR